MEDWEAAFHELTDKASQETLVYIQRGRHLRELSLVDLSATFVLAIRNVAADENDKLSRDAMADASAEYDLRGLQLPFDHKRDDVERIAERGKARLNAMSREEQERADQAIMSRFEEARKNRQ